MKLTILKGIGILLLCVGVINHLLDQLAVVFDGERTIWRVVSGLVGYFGFIIMWNIE